MILFYGGNNFGNKVYSGMKKYNSVSEFANNYDSFILDIWGVIHDGEKIYPGALDCLKHLKLQNKELIFLSNAPRRQFKVKQALNKFNISDDLYKDIVSSGELAFNYFSLLEPCNYLYIGPPKDADLLDGLGYQKVEKASDANFALVTGFDNDNSTLEEKLPLINKALAAGLKLYCVNPDLIVVRQDGSKALCAGVIGEYYQKQGGKTEFIGKPWPAIYSYIIGKFHKNAKICAIGDSIVTDIRGANNAGIDSVLVLGGILQAADKPLKLLLKEANVKPTYTIPKFSW